MRNISGETGSADQVDDRTFKGDFSEDGVAKLKEMVKDKLKEYMGQYTDHTLVEYVIVLLRNGRRKEEAKNELSIFLGDDSHSFVAWLWDHLAQSFDEYFISNVEQTTTKSSSISTWDEDNVPSLMDSEEKGRHPNSAPDIPPLLSSDFHKMHNYEKKDHKQRHGQSSPSPESQLLRKKVRNDDSRNEKVKPAAIAKEDPTTKKSAPAQVAIGSIGCGYDLAIDVRLKYCKGGSRLLDIEDGDENCEIVLPGGISIPNVSKSIKCDKGERMRFRSDVLPFQQMAERFNQELSLAGKIPSGLFNAMFEFSSCWQKDAAYTKNLAFDGIFISLYTVVLDKSQMLLRDHVKQAVPSTWDPAALARFIDIYGTHIIVGVKMGGKDVVYAKQQHSSKLQPDDLLRRLKEVADKRFVEADGVQDMASDIIYASNKVETKEQRLRFADTTSLGSYANKEDIVFMCKRRGGNDNRSLTHNEWLQTVQMEPDVISMSFIPITSLLNGVPGSGFLSHAINLYLRYKPPIEELHQFLEFQLPRQWAPVFSELPLGPQRRQQSCASLQFSFFGPKLYVNTTLVDVGKRPITGMRLYLEGRRSNRLAIHLQHLSSLPKIFQLDDDPNRNIQQVSHDRRYYEKVNWKNYSHVCTAPVESEDDLSVVTGAQLHVESHGFKNVLFLRLCFSAVVGATLVKNSEWDEVVGFAPKSGLISTLISHHFTAAQKPPPRPADVNINSAIYPGGPPVPVQAPKLLKFVDTSEMTRGPQESPGYWVVSGARLLVEKGKISLKVKYSLLTAILGDEVIEGPYHG